MGENGFSGGCMEPVIALGAARQKATSNMARAAAISLLLLFFTGVRRPRDDHRELAPSFGRFS